MKIARTGIILNTEKYEECVSFYRDLFNLKIIYTEGNQIDGITCFDFFGSYLMVETGGYSNPIGKSKKENSTKLRINVEDIEKSLIDIKAFGIDAKIIKNDWGSTINIFDPDGNRIGIRDEQSFSKQLKS